MGKVRAGVPESGPVLELSDLVVEYGDVRALQGISFSIPAGSITGLVGRNGAGKSTTIRAIAGIETPVSGVIRVFEREQGADRSEMLRETGFLLDTLALFSYVTGEEMLRWLGEAYGLSRNAASIRTDDLLDFFDLEQARHRVLDEYSTGMRKRIAIAAALIHAPSLLVLDEPFVALDPLMVRRLKNLFLQFSEARGTILLSSHLIDTVEQICDRIVIIEEGQIVVADECERALKEASERLTSVTLEELYASVVTATATRSLSWLTDFAR